MRRIEAEERNGSAMTTEHEVRRSMLKEALRGVMEEARERSASLADGSPDRHFYLGVALAAADQVHPETAGARAPGWLEEEDLALREGYLAMESRIAALVMSDELPVRVRLPDPER